jgi:hypothetical protein
LTGLDPDGTENEKEAVANGEGRMFNAQYSAINSDQGACSMIILGHQYQVPHSPEVIRPTKGERVGECLVTRGRVHHHDKSLLR